MTNREFYVAITEANLSEEITAHAVSLLEKLDASNAKRAEKVTEKKAENLARMADVVALLTNEPQTASDLHDAIGESVQKTSYLLRLAVAEGKAAVTDIKVKGKSTQKGYTAIEGAPATETTDEAASF